MNLFALRKINTPSGSHLRCWESKVCSKLYSGPVAVSSGNGLRFLLQMETKIWTLPIFPLTLRAFKGSEGSNWWLDNLSSSSSKPAVHPALNFLNFALRYNMPIIKFPSRKCTYSLMDFTHVHPHNHHPDKIRDETFPSPLMSASVPFPSQGPHVHPKAVAVLTLVLLCPL